MIQKIGISLDKLPFKFLEKEAKSSNFCFHQEWAYSVKCAIIIFWWQNSHNIGRSLFTVLLTVYIKYSGVTILRSPSFVQAMKPWELHL